MYMSGIGCSWYGSGDNERRELLSTQGCDKVPNATRASLGGMTSQKHQRLIILVECSFHCIPGTRAHLPALKSKSISKRSLYIAVSESINVMIA